MNFALNNLKIKIDGIKKHLIYAENLQKVLLLTKNGAANELKEPSDYLRNENTSERTFNYRSNIISLYGAFEHFIEEITKEYVDELLKHTQHFSQLNEKIQKNYFTKWKSLSEKLSWSKYAHLDDQKLIVSLHESYIQDNPSLLFECFLLNGGNYKHSVVSELFASLGLDELGSKLSKYEPLSTWMKDNGLFEKQANDQYHTLNDLVERRNEISHGSEPASILSDDQFLTLVEFIYSYSISLCSFLSDAICSIVWQNLGNDKYKPVNTYKKSVAELEVSNINLKKGEKLLIMNSKESYPRFLYTTVKEIRQSDNGQIEVKDEISVGNEVSLISIEVTDVIKTTTSFKFRLQSAKEQ